MQVERRGLGALAAAAATYTIGVPFFALESRVRFAHPLWHLFVCGGAAFECVALSQRFGGTVYE